MELKSIDEVGGYKRQAITIQQLEVLYGFLEKHPAAVTDCRSKEGAARSKVLWAECARLLNRVGPARPGLQWRKVWNDLKSRLRAKVRTNGVDSLTTLEQKLLSILINLQSSKPNKIPNFEEQRTVAASTSDKNEFVYELLEEFVLEDETMEETFTLDSPPENPSPSPSPKEPKPMQDLNEQESEESATEPDDTGNGIEDVRRYARVINTVEQLDLLAAFVKKHPILIDPGRRGKEAAARAQVLWDECARLLNRVGPPRPGSEWRKVWNDLKCRVRTKIRTTGLNTLTSLEQKILNVLRVNRIPSGPKNIPNFEEQSTVASTSDNKDEYEILEEFVIENEPSQEIFTIDSSPKNPLEPSPPSSPQKQESRPLPRPKKQKSSRSPSPKELRPFKRNKRKQKSEEPATEPEEKSKLDGTHAALLKIEQTRAEAELRNAQALSSFAESFRLIAESVDRFVRKCCED